MNMAIRLQQAIDNYLQQREQIGHDTSSVFSSLAQYLVHCSDLFQEPEWDESNLSEWEAELEEQMVRLLDGDTEAEHDLGALPLDRLEPAHIRDFIGWFLPRESVSSDVIREHGRELGAWFGYLKKHGYWSNERHLDFLAALHEVVEEAARACMLARVLYFYVRSGSAMSPKVRGKRFTRFAEGHARVARVNGQGIHFHFDSQGHELGPVVLPDRVLEYVRQADVFDIELGQREGQWFIVDVGPVYPGCVYVEAEEFTGLHKIS